MKLKPIPQNTVIHTPTETEAKELLTILHENGYKWFDSYRKDGSDHWDEYTTKTCYNLRRGRLIDFEERTFYEEEGYTILTLAEFKEKYLIPSNSGELESQPAENKPQPKFKAGDKVKIVNDCGCHAYGLIGMVELVESRQVTVACSRGRIYCVPEWLEPYTDPETKEETKEETMETKDETKELNLCELLKGHEGEEFYSLSFGETTLTSTNNAPIYRLCFELKDGCVQELRKDGKNNNRGQCLIFPSRALYEQYPLDPYTAWMKWQEEQNKHWVSVTAWIDDIECESDTAIDTNKIYFRTPADRDKCLEEIKAIIEKYSK